MKARKWSYILPWLLFTLLAAGCLALLLAKQNLARTNSEIRSVIESSAFLQWCGELSADSAEATICSSGLDEDAALSGGELERVAGVINALGAGEMWLEEPGTPADQPYLLLRVSGGGRAYLFYVYQGDSGRIHMLCDSSEEEQGLSVGGRSDFVIEDEALLRLINDASALLVGI